ncbi:MAG: GNAT family N-acetyltransferase [Acidobacteria bacterium]|nr:GNAT family N-acetyltransferase [Acidobacteriota bacterium]
MTLFADRALARRLEGAEGRTNAEFVETRRAVDPARGSEWMSVAGAYAMFDGADSALTQTFGMGVLGDPSEDDLDAVEHFFEKRGAPVFHEMSPLIDFELLDRLAARGYRPMELSNVLCLRLKAKNLPRQLAGEGLPARAADKAEAEAWARVGATGWAEFSEYADQVLDLLRISARMPCAMPFVAELDGRPVATAMLQIQDRVALLAGASTIPEARRRGAQRALLAARLARAVDEGCDLAMLCATPGSVSQRNAQRYGFQVAYTRIKWGRWPGPGPARAV